MRKNTNINYSRNEITCIGFFPSIIPQPRTFDLNDLSKLKYKDIKVKIIAGYDTWQIWLDQYLDSPSNITFEYVEPYISRLSKKEKLWLSLYAHDQPDSFMSQFYYQFLYQVSLVNPNRQNKRRIIPYREAKAHDKRHEIIIVSRWMYAFFYYWQCRSRCKWPRELIAFLRRHDITLSEDRPVYTTVAESIEVVYKNENPFSKDVDGASLYHNYIKHNLTDIRKFLESKDFLPTVRVRKPSDGEAIAEPGQILAFLQK